MNNLHDLFEHELKDVYAAEQQILKMLEKMQEEGKDPTIRQAVEQHHGQTKQQIERIEHVMQSLNLRQSGASCPTVEGLVREKQSFLKEQPAVELLDMYNLGAGVKTERYEISAYETLLDLAEKLNIQDVAAPLQESLREEQAMLDRLKQASRSMRMSEGMMKGGQGTSQGARQTQMR